MTECKLSCGTNAPGFLGYWKQPTKSDGIFGDAARITLIIADGSDSAPAKCLYDFFMKNWAATET